MCSFFCQQTGLSQGHAPDGTPTTLLTSGGVGVNVGVGVDDDGVAWIEDPRGVAGDPNDDQDGDDPNPGMQVQQLTPAQVNISLE